MAQATTRMTTRLLSAYTVTIPITPMLARLMATTGQTGSKTGCLSVPARGSRGFAADSSIEVISSEGGDSEAVLAGVAAGTAAVLGAAEADSTAAEADSTAGEADSMAGEADSMAGVADSMAGEADSTAGVADLTAAEAASAAAEAASAAAVEDLVEAVAFMEAVDSMVVEAADSTAVVEADFMVVVATEAADSTAVEVMAAATDN